MELSLALSVVVDGEAEEALAACREDLVLHAGRAICRNYSWKGEKTNPELFEILQIIALLRLQSDKILVGLFAVYLAWLLGVIRADLARDRARSRPNEEIQETVSCLLFDPRQFGLK